jgi:hypothetical protein
MLLMGMHALVLKKAKEMKRGRVVLPVGNHSLPFGAFEKLAGGKAVVDELKLLHDNTPGSHIEMTDFGRSLISIRQSHGFAAAIEKAVRIFGAYRIDYRSFGHSRRIAVGAVIHTPAVTNDKYYRSHG